MKWMNKGHEYDALAKIVCEDGYQYYMWGAGKTGRRLYTFLKDKVTVLGFVDSNKEKQKSSVDGLPVVAPETIDFSAKNVRYLVSPAFYEEIAVELKKKNLKENVDFFNSLFWARLYLVYKYDEALLYDTTMSITARCTLKCKKCCMFMPYYKDAKHRELEAIKADVDAFFSKVDYTVLFRILGGETFLYPQLKEFVGYVIKNYRDRIGSLELLTNGTLRLSDELLEFLSTKDVYITISNYTEFVPYKKRLDEFCEELNKWNIGYACIEESTWADLGFPETPYGLTEADDVEAHTESCKNACRGLYNKKLYFCQVENSAIRSGLFEEKEDDYIALDAEISKKELVEFDMGYCEKGYLDFCKECRGYNSTIIIPPGEQM